MNELSTSANAMNNPTQVNNTTGRLATFGAVHLNITNLEKFTFFWTKIVGMNLRETIDNFAEFGTENKTL